MQLSPEKMQEKKETEMNRRSEQAWNNPIWRV